MSLSKCAFIGLLSILLLSYSPLIIRNIIRPPPKSPPSNYRVIKDFFSKDLQQRLLKIYRDASPYVTAIDDQTAKYQHIGEAKPINPDGSCPHPYLVPDKERKICQLVSRMDVGRHQLLTGGYEGHKDFFNRTATRLMIFEKYKWGYSQQDIEQEFNELIYENKEFLSAAHDICGKERPILQPYELLMAIQTPGQTSPLHLDSAFFYGASRFLFPLWLLVSMYESGIYEDRRIPQVQAVTYIHDWQWKQGDGGEFLWYDKGIHYDPVIIPPHGRSAVLVDGSTTVHGTTIFKPDVDFPVLDKDKPYEMEYIGNEQWRVYTKDGGRDYIWNATDLRFAIVFRARCYRSEEERDGHDPKEEKDLSVERIKKELVEDMIKNGRYGGEGKGNVDDRDNALELALKFMDEYIHLPYPVKTAWIPFNYCMLPKADESLAFLEPLLGYICG